MTDLSNPPMEITDLGTLMKLEQMVESGSEAILGQVQLNDLLQERREQEKKPENELNCNRCHQLKNQNKLLEYKLKEETGPPTPGKVTRLADHVASFNRQAILRSVFKQIYSRSVIFYVIDITNFEGSQIDEVYDLINNHKHKVLVIVNKIDALPKGFTVDRLQLWVKRQIEHKFGNDIDWTICLSSAKLATGCAKVLEIL